MQHDSLSYTKKVGQTSRPGFSVGSRSRFHLYHTPSPPSKSFPTKSPRVKLSGRPPIKLYGHENSHPLELRVCLSQTLRNPNS